MPRFFMLVLLLAAGVITWGAEGKIIACYGDACVKTPPPGWQHLWNANGEIGNSANYLPRTYVDSFRMYSAIVDGAGKVSGPRDNYLPGYRKDLNEIPRYVISAYTLPSDSEGDVWLTNGNLQTNIGSDAGVILKIYVNDTLQSTTEVKKGRKPYLFQYNFGALKKDDTIYVMVGPSGSTGNFIKLLYTLELFPAGQKPSDPTNIVSPDITESAPKMGANGRPDHEYMRIHQYYCDTALKGRPEVVFLGDSITQGWNNKVMAEKLGKYKPANFGISGDWIQNVLWRVDNGVLDQLKPKVIVLMIGTNNLANGFTVDEVSTGIETIIKALRAKTPESKILLLGIFPRGQSIVKNPIYDSIKQVNANISRLADGQMVRYMDIGDKLVEADGSISKEVFPDGLHPSEKGYIIWADAIIPTLEEMTTAQ